MSTCAVTLFLHPPPPLPSPPLHFPKLKSLKSPRIICFSSISTANPDPEESRWLREEQRWLREEQRWLREEQRWARDRDSLLRQISDLKLKIEALERRGGESDTVANIAGLLQLLKDKNLIAETGSSSRAMELERHQPQIQEEEVAAVSEVKEVIAVSDVKRNKKRRSALRKGSEGEEVQALQEALLKLGFYSGEEDMEFSSFTSGTERAVKTWQASLDLPQDGIMTPDLIERLYMEPKIEGTNDEGMRTQKEGANGAAVTSVTEISEVQQTIVKEVDTQLSRPRVFLLGENRWEDSSRLERSQNKGGGGKSIDTPRCIACLGVGRLLCTECDGTGDFNLEEQFLDWVEEGAKCPYCEGHGFTVCDVCEGRTLA